jgi:hypothetical protein
MGYTHYWTYKPSKIKDTEELRKKFRQAVCWIDQAHKLIKKNPSIHQGQAGGYHDDVPCRIRGGLGRGTPIINESGVWFNGDEKTEMSHETFRILWDKEGRDFCKTARKPYDLLVCVSLLAMNEAFKGTNGAFKFSSDGDNSDWETAKDVFTRITGSFDGEIFPEEAHLEMV